MRIWKFEGADLAALLRELDDPAYCVRFADDGDGLKIKVDGGMWTLGLGALEVSR